MPSYLNMVDRLIEAASVRSKWRALRRPLEAGERRMGRVFRQQGLLFLDGFGALRGRFSEGRLVETLTEDDWLRIWDRTSSETFDLFFTVLQTMMEQGLAIGAAVQIANVQVDYAFDLRNPRAVAYIEQFGAARVTQINETTRGEIRSIVQQGTAEGWSYDRVAREINRRFREFAVGRPQEHIDSRGHLVAVTELGNAYEAGNAIVIDDLIAGGLAMEKKWLTVGDDRVSAGCQANQAEGWIPYAQAFVSGHQRPLRFPGCRCTALYRRQRA